MQSSCTILLQFVLFDDQREDAAFFAMSEREDLLNDLARALLPANSLLRFAGYFNFVSSISPIAILATCTAQPITSAGRCSPFGPLGTLNTSYADIIYYIFSKYPANPAITFYPESNFKLRHYRKAPKLETSAPPDYNPVYLSHSRNEQDKPENNKETLNKH